jgi:hypothetical protein
MECDVSADAGKERVVNPNAEATLPQLLDDKRYDLFGENLSWSVLRYAV